MFRVSCLIVLCAGFLSGALAQPGPGALPATAMPSVTTAAPAAQPPPTFSP